MVLAVHRVLGHVAQGVVHPAQVPLEAEAETANVGGPGHHRPGSRLLGHGKDAGMAFVDQFVHALEECDGLQVLVASMHVGDPLSVLAAVVQVEHGRHGIHAQSVDVVLVKPEQGVGRQKIGDLGAAVVVDQGAPFHVTALARVGVLVKVGAVEPDKTVLVLGEVSRHPVKNDADAGLVAGLYEGAKVVGRTETAGRRKQADGLVSPRAVEGKLVDGH